MRMTLHNVLLVLIVGNVILSSNFVQAETCRSWQDLRPYIQKFYELDTPHKDNLVRHFNAVAPRTNLHPDRVGYGWFSGGEFVKLYMIQNDCVVLDRYYPRKMVWKLMGAGPSSGLDFDKSGKSYAEALAKRAAIQDKVLARRQTIIQESLEEQKSPSTDDVIFDQDIN